MIVIIAGGRDIEDMSRLLRAIKSAPFLEGKSITKVVCGCQTGADTLGEHWAIANGIEVQYFQADWIEYGKRAGFLRNERMARSGEALIALWDGQSPGTKDMISRAAAHELPCHIG